MDRKEDLTERSSFGEILISDETTPNMIPKEVEMQVLIRELHNKIEEIKIMNS